MFETFIIKEISELQSDLELIISIHILLSLLMGNRSTIYPKETHDMSHLNNFDYTQPISCL